ncbi:MAG: AMP-binding protein [Anaerolineae bacterium]
MSTVTPQSPAETTSLPDYAEFVRDFRPEHIAAMLSGDLETGINVCYEACDRHAPSGRVALRWEGVNGESAEFTYAQLQEQSARFANFLRAQGIGPGDRVACLLPRIPELIIVALGAWRVGGVYLPLFTAFGPKAIEYRLERSGAKLIVTDTTNRAKLASIAKLPPVMIVSGATGDTPDGDIPFAATLTAQPTQFEPVMRRGEDPFLLLFTSGTVGLAKGVAVPIKALMAFIVYMRYAMGVTAEDRYWNVADPGWAYGLYYAVTTPLVLGYTTHFYQGGFTTESTYRMLEKYGITLLAAAPTAYRMLMAAGPAMAKQHSLQLRAACSAGEPLNPEAIRWVADNLDITVFDQYGQTEIGMAVCNYNGLRADLIPGSMGLPMPGFDMVAVDANLQPVGTATPGQVAVRIATSPLYFFQGYWQQDTLSIRDGYYLTGDVAELDDHGHFFFTGRNDDIITSAGYRIGPFDVESALIEHPAVAEAAVIGKPDEERGEIVKAFVVLRSGYEASSTLEAQLKRYVRERLSAHAFPREISFVTELPKTPSGKIQRFLLRQQSA